MQNFAWACTLAVITATVAIASAEVFNTTSIIDKGCRGSTAGDGAVAVGCVRDGCCRYNYQISSRCNGDGFVCCYSEDMCGGDLMCEGSKSDSGAEAIGCIEKDCCEWSYYIDNVDYCSNEGTVCCYSSNSCNCASKGWVDYRGKVISDSRTRNKLEQIADYFCTRLWVTSGDRSGTGSSLHNVGRAGDFWLDGFDANRDGQKIWDGLRASGLFNDEAWEVIWHGAYTCTGGIHFHVGRYAYARDTCYKMEGTTPNNVCDYRCHPL